MSTITGVTTWNTVVTVVAASSGDGDTIAAMFNGEKINGVSVTTAAVATNASGIVTIYWPQTSVRAGNGSVQTVVAGLIAADTALTSPVTVGVATSAWLTA